VVASLFVNPTQFDVARISPAIRRTHHDGALAAEAGVDLLFTPQPAEMYPDGFQTFVEVEEVSRDLEGESRPGHFRGVATVCLKLFNIVRPDRAYFGQKDAQQVAVLERMVSDLDLELELRVVPTIRDADGLAISSRNVHLSPEERRKALILPRALNAGVDTHRSGIGHPDVVARTILLCERGVAIDYCALARWNGRLVLAAAITVGGTRLIDNVVLEGAPT
jgi:pantoate--beta-alanine ligase